MKRPWFAELEPTTPREVPGDSVLPERARMLAELLGPGPAGWAVELGATMAATITATIPQLAVDAVADEVAKGCEAVALGALSALAFDEQVPFAAMPEVLAGPTEVVSRGIGIEHMLRSIHLAHSTAVDVLLDAAERHHQREQEEQADLLPGQSLPPCDECGEEEREGGEHHDGKHDRHGHGLACPSRGTSRHD